jgi:arylformamidase
VNAAGGAAGALEGEYNIRARHPDHQTVRDGWAAATARVKAAREWHEDLRYGAHERQTLDLFPAPEIGGPLLIFIHGGYWRSNEKTNYGFIAEPITARGGALAAINYGLAPETPVARIVEQVRAAVVWLHGKAEKGRFDRNRIHVAGHSAGGHLAAELAATDWPAYGLPSDVIKSAVPISGLFDLAPLLQTSINDDLRLDAESARLCSPLHRLPLAGTALTVAVGAGETDEFVRQSRDYAEACRAAGLDCDFLSLAELNHYTVLNAFLSPETALTRAVLVRMGLA